jgi:hypothetical protein
MSDFITPEGPVTPPRLLDAADIGSSTWRKLRIHMEQQRDDLRAQNDNPALDPIATATLRGRLKCLSNLLELGAPPTLADAADEDEPD